MTDSTASLNEFVDILASSEPAPGGGGAAGLVGAVGTALCCMVGSLTTGKKKYAEVEETVQALMAECRDLQKQQLDTIVQDAEGFLPLAKAYGIPKDDPERDAKLETATMGALSVPMNIMKLACKSIDATAKMAEIGSRLAISDAGCAVTILKSSLQAAYLNVLINTKSLKNREVASQLNTEAAQMVKDYGEKADQIYAMVRDGLIS